MRSPRFRSIAVPIVLSLGTFALTRTTAAQQIDFTRSPAAGLEYRVVSKNSTRGSQTMSAAGQTREFTIESERSSVFADKILEVKAGKTTGMEREYEDITSKQVARAEGREPRERDRASPLAWKHFRVRWDDDDAATVQVKADDAWADAEEGLKRALRPERLRRALFPLPAEAKSIGDTWELTEQQKKDYFPKRAVRGRNGEEGPSVEQEVTGRLEFAEITDYREMKCAVIKGRFEIKTRITADDGEGSTATKLEQTCYYSLRHRIVVGVTGTNETEGAMSQLRGEMSIAMTTAGKGSSEIAVTVERPGKRAESGE